MFFNHIFKIFNWLPEQIVVNKQADFTHNNTATNKNNDNTFYL